MCITKKRLCRKSVRYYPSLFNFFYEFKLFIAWFIANVILNSQKYLLWRYSKWRKIKQNALGLNRGLSWNSWLLRSANNVKIIEEYVMCSEKNVLVKKMFTNGLNMSLLLQARVEKTVYWLETHWISGKEKVLGVAVSKTSHADSVLGYERTHDYKFLVKKKRDATVLTITNSLGEYSLYVLYVPRILYIGSSSGTSG